MLTKWLMLAFSAFQQILPTILAVEQAHASKAGIDKKAIAMDLIAKGSGLAEQVDPADKDKIDAITTHVGQGIDLAVAALKDARMFTSKKTPPPAPAPARVA